MSSEKIYASKTTKEAYNILNNAYDCGDNKVRKEKLQSLKRQYELIDMIRIH